MDYGAGGYDPAQCNVGVNARTGLIQLEIKGLAEPKSPEAERICREDLNELITSFVQDIYQAGLPCEIMHFVRKGMRKHPSERFQSMVEMADTFRKARSGRFRVQCYFTLMKRGAQALAHLVDNHPIFVTAVFAAVVLGLPTLAAMAFLRHP